jgi:hypothetical protein
MPSRYLFTMLASILLLALGACGQSAGGTEPLQAGEVVELTGTVVDTIGDCAFDGICAYVVDTERGQVTVIWSRGLSIVEAEDVPPCLGSLDQGIAVGDTVDIRAAAIAEDRVSICASQDYFVQVQ